MVPEEIRKPWFVVPLCICSLTLGLLLLSFVVFPETHPEVYERIMLKHYLSMVITIGSFCVSLPILLLLLVTRKVDDQ